MCHDVLRAFDLDGRGVDDRIIGVPVPTPSLDVAVHRWRRRRRTGSVGATGTGTPEADASGSAELPRLTGRGADPLLSAGSPVQAAVRATAKSSAASVRIRGRPALLVLDEPSSSAFIWAVHRYLENGGPVGSKELHRVARQGNVLGPPDQVEAVVVADRDSLIASVDHDHVDG